MIGEIIDAVIKEARELLKDTGGTVILKTNFLNNKEITYSLPLLLVDIVEGADSGQYHGGATHADWMFAFNSYNYEPNAYADDASGYSSTLLNIIDTIRQHFSIGQWLTPGMTTIENDYCFRYTLSGIVPADALDQDGLVMGYRVVFDSIAIDNSTNSVQMSDQVLEHVVQTDYPPTT